jgi:hypothetical protein
MIQYSTIIYIYINNIHTHKIPAVEHTWGFNKSDDVMSYLFLGILMGIEYDVMGLSFGIYVMVYPSLSVYLIYMHV